MITVKADSGDNLTMPFLQAVEKQLPVSCNLPKESKLLEDVNLPLILQCGEYVNSKLVVGDFFFLLNLWIINLYKVSLNIFSIR